MTPPPSNLDIVTVAIVMATWALGAEAAAIVGPYTVILLSAVGGAAWSASRRRAQRTRVGTLVHMLLSVGLALIATVPLSELIARWTDLQARWTLAPAAVLIAARPDWIWQQVRDRIGGRDRP